MKRAIISLFIFLVLSFGGGQAATMTPTCKDNSSDETGFRVERRLQAEDDTKYVEVGRVDANMETFTDNMSYEETYCYQVIAFNEVYASQFSNVACGFTVPNTPSGFNVTN